MTTNTAQCRDVDTLYFRNINHPMVRPSVVTRRQEQRNESAQARFSGIDERRSHIFDREVVTYETAAFQLCDITDPMLKEMLRKTMKTRSERRATSVTGGTHSRAGVH